MGADTTVKIWVGVRASYQDDEYGYDTQKIASKLPKELFDIKSYNDEPPHDIEYSSSYFSGDEKSQLIEKYGCIPEFITSENDTEGFGVVIAEHDWDNGPSELDLYELLEDFRNAKAQLQELFHDHGVVAEINVWWQTDYS